MSSTATGNHLSPIDIIPLGPLLAVGSLGLAILVAVDELPASPVNLGTLRHLAEQALRRHFSAGIRVHGPNLHSASEWSWLGTTVAEIAAESVQVASDGREAGSTADFSIVKIADSKPTLWPDHPLAQPQDDQGWQQFSDTADRLARLGAWAESLGDTRCLDEVIAIWRLHPPAATNNEPMPLIAARRELACGNPAEAWEMLDRWQPSARAVRRSRWLAMVNILEFLGDYQAASGLLDLAERLSDPKDWEVRAHRAVLQLRLGHLDDLAASPLPDDNAERIPDTVESAMWASTVGIACFRLGRYRNAIAWHQLALSVRNRLGDLVAVARSWNNIGNVHIESGAFDEAREAFEMAESLLAQAGEVVLRATVANNLGSLLLLTERFDEARTTVSRAFDLKEASGETPGRAIAQATLAAIELGAGNLEEARRYLWDARITIESCGLEENLPDVGILDAELALAEGAHERAGKLLLDLLASIESSRPTLLPRIHRGLARVAHEMSQQSRTDHHLIQALRASGNSERRHERSRTLALAAKLGRPLEDADGA